jgi:hypothetical protein
MKPILTLTIAVLLNFAAANANGATTADITCSQALANVGQVKVGITESRVLELFGQPTAIKEGVWGYNFWDCAPRPKVGQQLIFGIALTFEDGVVSKIGYDTICATGPGT